MYEQFKASVLGKKLTSVQGVTDPYGVQCVVVAWAWANFLFPRVPLSESISTGNAITLLENASSKYFTRVSNNPDDPSQLPPQGALVVFGANVNPDGHVGIYDSGNEATGDILQQNAPNMGEAVNVGPFSWAKQTPMGWLIPVVTTSNPIPAPVPNTKTLHLLPSVSVWHVYKVGGPYTPSAAIHILDPAKAGGLSYTIESTLAPNVYEIDTEDFGNVAIYANPSIDACIIS